ncbi:MAG: hypothetical protein J6I79_00840 [Paludibacteraceae bacterium]|nr:hypothetical protein [Paludibacteraceae bacterium]
MRFFPISLKAGAFLLSLLSLSACMRDVKIFDQTLDSDTKQPFGSNFFVAVLNAQSDSLCKKPYKLCSNSFFELYVGNEAAFFSNTPVAKYSSSFGRTNAILLEADDLAIDDSLFNRLYDGCNTLIASQFENMETLDGPKGEPIGLVEGEFFSSSEFVKVINSGSFPMVEVCVDGLEKKVRVPSFLCTRSFNERALPYLTDLLERNGFICGVSATAGGRPIALRCENRKNGAVMSLVTTPLLFTNFGISFDHWCAVDLVNALMRSSGLYSAETGKSDRLQPLALHCNGSYSYTFYKGAYEKEPVFKDVMAPKETNHNYMGNFYGDLAKFVLFVLAAVFSVFLFRRRRHSVPLFDGYRNRTADYVRQVGVLYYADSDLALVLKNKVVFFFSEVADRLHVQLSENEKIVPNAAFLAAAVGCPNTDMTGFLKQANAVLDGLARVDAAILADMSDKMNLIVAALRGELVHDQLVAVFK